MSSDKEPKLHATARPLSAATYTATPSLGCCECKQNLNSSVVLLIAGVKNFASLESTLSWSAVAAAGVEDEMSLFPGFGTSVVVEQVSMFSGNVRHSRCPSTRRQFRPRSFGCPRSESRHWRACIHSPHLIFGLPGVCKNGGDG